MAQARVYVVTSLLETFGLTLLEAMGSGVPVVASDATCHREVGGDAAIYCDPHDSRDVSKQIGRVVDDAELSERCRRLGLDRVGRFSWANSAAGYVAVLKAAIQGTDSRSSSPR